MAQSISNVSDLSKVISAEHENVYSSTEELRRVNKVKYNLGIVYFLALSALMVTLFV